MVPDNYTCEGQITLNDFLRKKIGDTKVMDLTTFINSQGKAQYTQIGELVREVLDEYKETDGRSLADTLTNHISVYVLEQSLKYMKYLKQEAE